MSIHPTAIVDPGAEIGEGVEIGPWVLVEDRVRIGRGTRILAGARILRYTEMGEGNVVHYGAVLGNLPQDITFKDAESYLRIGNRNVFREYVTLHRGTEPGSETVVGDECYFMVNSHVGHNCRVGNRVILVNNSPLAGHVVVEDGANISGNVVVHQFCRVGRLAMVSGDSALDKDIPPFTLAAGRLAKIYGLNLIGLRRAGIPAEGRKEIKAAFRTFYRSGLPVKEALEELEKGTPSGEVRHFIDFIKKDSRRGIAGYISRRK